MAVNRHLMAFYENADQALGAVVPVDGDDGDDLVRVENSTEVRPIVGLNPTLFGAYIAAADIELARITSATLRTQNPYPYITPLSGVISPGTPPAFADLRRNPITLAPNETWELEVENDLAGVAQDIVGLLWFGDIPSPVQAQWQTVRMTPEGTAGIAGDWVLDEPTFVDKLREGTYEIGGIHAVGANAIGIRHVQPDSKFKPGALCWDSLEDAAPPIFRYGNWGTMGTFTTERPPTFEVFSNGVAALDYLYVDIRKVN